MTPPGDPIDSGDTPPTLIATLAEHARSRPASKAFVFLDENDGQTEWTYGDLASRTDAAAAEIARLAAPGDRALLVYPPGLTLSRRFSVA